MLHCVGKRWLWWREEDNEYVMNKLLCGWVKEEEIIKIIDDVSWGWLGVDNGFYRGINVRRMKEIDTKNKKKQ